jgi:glycosyltransferase involved in cell wall biosynthesis
MMFARYFDHVFVAQPEYLPNFADLGHDSVYWLPLGGDPGVHFMPDQSRDIDVGFVGKLGTAGTERHAVLSRVLSRFSTNDYTRPHTPWEMGQIYSRSKIVFNKSIGGDVNMRVFEALAAGALLVTDRIGNGLEELLTEGEHYVGYDTAEEAVAQIERYLSDESARARIAQSGQNLLRARHTYDARLGTILEVVRTAGDARTAPARRATRGERLRWRAQWARQRGLSTGDALRLVVEGLSLAAYGDLAVGLARRTKHQLTAAIRRAQ